MQEPATTSAFLAVMCAIGVVSGSDAYPVVISSFAGATLYMITNNDISIIRRWIYFSLSFVIGITASHSVGELISKIIPFIDITVDQSIGALISSAFVVKFLVKTLESKDVEDSIIKALIKKLSGNKRRDD